MKIGFRSSKNIDVSQSNLKDLVTTSEANQWKIHSFGQRVSTSNNQIFLIKHGLPYTPLYIVGIRIFDPFSTPSLYTYYDLGGGGGGSYIDNENLQVQLGNAGSMFSYIIFKDFGA